MYAIASALRAAMHSGTVTAVPNRRGRTDSQKRPTPRGSRNDEPNCPCTTLRVVTLHTHLAVLFLSRDNDTRGTLFAFWG